MRGQWGCLGCRCAKNSCGSQNISMNTKYEYDTPYGKLPAMSDSVMSRDIDGVPPSSRCARQLRFTPTSDQFKSVLSTRIIRGERSILRFHHYCRVSFVKCQSNTGLDFSVLMLIQCLSKFSGELPFYKGNPTITENWPFSTNNKPFSPRFKPVSSWSKPQLSRTTVGAHNNIDFSLISGVRHSRQRYLGASHSCISIHADAPKM